MFHMGLCRGNILLIRQGSAYLHMACLIRYELCIMGKVLQFEALIITQLRQAALIIYIKESKQSVELEDNKNLDPLETKFVGFG